MATGVPVYNPTTGTPTVSETIANTVLSTSLNGAVSAGATTAVLNSVIGIVANSWVIIDAESNNAGKVEVVQVTSIVSNTITFFPALINNHATNAPVTAVFQRQVMVLGSYSTSNFADVNAAGTSATTALGVQGVSNAVPVRVNEGGAQKVILGTSAVSGSISTSARNLCSVINASTSTQNATISFFDEGASPAGATTDLVYAAQLGPSQIVILNIPLTNGLAYSLSGSALANIIVTWSNYA
jgi:hypothetical protein